MLASPYTITSRNCACAGRLNAVSRSAAAACRMRCRTAAKADTQRIAAAALLIDALDRSRSGLGLNANFAIGMLRSAKVRWRAYAAGSQWSRALLRKAAGL